MSVHSFRRPVTPIARACPAYADAMDTYERAVRSGNDKAIDNAWRHVLDVREIFEQGAEFALASGSARR